MVKIFIKVGNYFISYELTFHNVMHDIRYESIDNMEVTIIIEDKFIGNSIGCCDMASKRAI